MMSSMPMSIMRDAAYPCAPHHKVHSDNGAAQAQFNCAFTERITELQSTFGHLKDTGLCGTDTANVPKTFQIQGITFSLKHL